MKIMVVGPGGIGGYLAGMLSRNHEDITLIARGNTLKAIEENGLTVETDTETFTLRPSLITDSPEKAGIQDVVFMCTKGYDLEDAAENIRPAVGEDTLVIPMLNGVTASKRIAEKLQKGIVCGGCIYIFSRIAAPGHITQNGPMNRVIVGIPGAKPNAALLDLCERLKAAGIDAAVSEDIRQELWIKWSFILSNAQATSYYDMNVGQIRERPEGRRMLIGLLEELIAVAALEGISLPEGLLEANLKKVDAMPYESRSSLSRDLATPGKMTELSLFAGALCAMADAHGIEVPYNRMVLDKFRDRV